MRIFTIGALIGACAAPITAQTPRPSVNLDPASSFTFDAIPATQGEASVVLYSSGNAAAGLAHVVAQRSDGRGLVWTSPAVKVDLDPAGARKDLNDPSYVQFGTGDNVYVIWEDLRSGQSEPWFARSFDGGATWDPEIKLPFGFPSGLGHLVEVNGAGAMRMAVAQGAPDRIYVALAADALGGADAIFLVSSLDGGASFGPAIPVNGALGDVDSLDLKADGLSVHVAFDDDRAGADDVYYNRSSDGGATFDFGTGKGIDGAIGSANSGPPLSLTLNGSVVAVAYPDEPGAQDQLFVTVSQDGGASFGAPVQVGNYPIGVADVDNPRMMASASNLVVVWEDNRTGADEIYAATSTDGGTTWVEFGSFGPGGFPRVSGITLEDGVGLGWTEDAVPGSFLAVTSIDHGVSFSPVVKVSDTLGDADFGELKWNELYGNFVCTWLADDLGTNRAYAGGFRPQTLTPNGWVGGPTVVNFDFARFDTGCGLSAWALVNFSGPGTLILPDGRNLGLLLDPLLTSSVTLAVSGVASSVLNPSGSGSTPAIPITLPAGLTLYGVGVGIGAGVICDITDVVAIPL